MNYTNEDSLHAHHGEHDHHEHEECDCACHDNGHHSHGDGHDHSHHEHEDEGPVAVHLHEGAYAASFQKESNRILSECVTVVSAEIIGLRDWANISGGIIGHIKASVTCGDTVVLVNTTGDEVYTRRTDGPVGDKCIISMNAIIFGTNEESLRFFMEGSYGRL